jgi:hypothetical protein
VCRFVGESQNACNPPLKVLPLNIVTHNSYPCRMRQSYMFNLPDIVISNVNNSEGLSGHADHESEYMLRFHIRRKV